MSRVICTVRPLVLSAAVCALLAVSVSTALAQTNGTGTGTNSGNTLLNGLAVNRVGGVLVDAEGVLSNSDTDQAGQLRAIRQKAFSEVPADLDQPSPLRKVSLRRLEAALAELTKSGKPISGELAYLAGITRVQYVLVYPDSQDIVLAGPAEGWTIDPAGNVVGKHTGAAMMLLDDLLVALRTAQGAARNMITCSIDPTDEGLRRLEGFMRGQGGDIGPNPGETISGIETSLGPQTITIGGVPADSHFARVLLAADYRMKRLGMNFEKSPVKGMTSFLETVRGGMTNMLPRWWLAPQYEPLLRDTDGLAWEIRGRTVRVMTEDDFVAETGARTASGKANPLAQKWADNMTAHYSDLAKKMPVFAELQNVMDLAIVGALIEKEQLRQRSGGQFERLFDVEALPTASIEVPRQVPSQASFIKRGRNYIISASGGVEISSWMLADKVETGEEPAEVRNQSLPGDVSRWWWD